MEENLTLLLILNPAAGTRYARRLLPEIIAMVTNYGHACLTFVTEQRGDATRFVEQYGDRAGKIVCIGGDGTFNETVTGLLRAGLRVPVGYIPAGSTNDFANSLHLPSDILEAARNIVEGEPVTLDAGRFRERYFAYVASFGAFTRASYETPQNVKNALGHLAYILEGMKDLPTIRPEHVKLVANGETFEDDYLFGAVSNSTSLGGILTLPQETVDMNDGMFEIMLVHMPKTAAELNEILTAVTSKQYRCGMIDFIRTSRAEVFASSAMDWSLDGEREKGCEHIVIENVRDALRLLTKERLT